MDVAMLQRFATPMTSAILPSSSPATAGLLLGGVEALGHGVPVDHVPPGLEVVGPAVLILQIVGMLPDVVAHDRMLPGGHRIVLVRRAGDLQLAVGGQHQPRPPAAELL